MAIRIDGVIVSTDVYVNMTIYIAPKSTITPAPNEATQ